MAPERRHLRRRAVEELLLRREPRIRIVVDVARQFGVSTRMVRRDIFITERRWIRWEERNAHRRLAMSLRVMDWSIRQAMSATPPRYGLAASIARDQARLLGYGSANVFVDARQQLAVVQAGGAAGEAEGGPLGAAAAALRRLDPGARRRALLDAIELPALPLASGGNGEGGNGSNGGGPG